MSTEKRISHAFISFLLILCMVCTMFGFVSPEIVSAEKGEMSEGQSVNTILIYGKNKENKDVLLAHLDVEDLEKYLNDNINTSIGKVHNYSIIDRYPTPVHQEAQGFYIYDLLDYAVKNSTSEEVKKNEDASFGDSDSDKVKFATYDSGGNYSEEYRYDALYGDSAAKRYNFPDLYKYWNYSCTIKNGTIDPKEAYKSIDQIWKTREEEEVMLSITAFSQRYINTAEKYKENNSEICDYNMENYWYGQGKLDTMKTMRLMLPMTEDEFRNATPTANNSRYGINNILFDLETDFDIDAGEVAEPTWEIIDGASDSSLDSDYYYVKLSCKTDGAAIYYDPLMNGGSSPTKEYKDGELLKASKKSEDWSTFRIRAVKDGCTDAGEVLVTNESNDDDPVTPVEGASVWDGETYDTSWYDGHEDDEVYELTTAAQFAGFAWLVNGKGVTEQTINDFEGKTIKLKTDVNLANNTWDPIGRDMGVYKSGYGCADWTKNYQFSGTFDGENHTISNIKLRKKVYSGTHQGLFGKTVGATIRNLTVGGSIDIDAKYVTGSGVVQSCACIIAHAEEETHITNCHNKAEKVIGRGSAIIGEAQETVQDKSITTPQPEVKTYITDCSSSASSEKGGAIAGSLYGFVAEITNCTNNAESITASGICDYISAVSSKISGCVNRANIAGSTSIGRGECTGGISSDSSGTIENCINYGNISVPDGYAGGITGSGGKITSCRNYGDICSDSSLVNIPDYAYLGGITGTGSCIDCVNYGKVICAGEGAAGGIKGYGGGVTGCLNLGEISAYNAKDGNYAAGITHMMSDRSNSHSVHCITDSCVNMGKVSASGSENNYTANIVNILSCKVILRNCLDVSGTSTINRIIGSGKGDYVDPQVENVIYREDGELVTEFKDTKGTYDEIVTDCEAENLDEMRKKITAETLGEKFTDAPGSYPLLKKFACTAYLSTPAGSETIVRDVYGNEIYGDGKGNYTLYEGGTYTYEVSKSGYATQKKTFKPQQGQEIFVSLKKTYEIQLITPEGSKTVVCDENGNEIIGDSAGNYTLCEGDTYSYEVSKEGYITKKGTLQIEIQKYIVSAVSESGEIIEKGTFRVQKNKQVIVNLEKTDWADINSITPGNGAANAAKVSGRISKVSGIIATANTKNKTMTITFRKVNGAKNYRIAYRKGGSKKWTYAWTAGKNKYVMKKLKNGGLYEFKISAYKKANGTWQRGKYSVTNYRYFKSVSQTVKSGKNQISVKIKKTKDASGYQVIYSANKSMKNAKTKTFKGSKARTAVIKKLKKNKKYYVQIRPYKIKNGHKYLGIVSAKKAFKVR